MRHRLPEIRLEAPVVSAASAAAAASPDETADRPYSPWILWDNRYWFRMRVAMSMSAEEDRNEPRTIPLIIRPLQQDDLKTIYHLLDQDQTHDRNHNHAHLQQLLSHQAPGTIRFTVPLITTTIAKDKSEKKQRPDSDTDSKGSEQEQEQEQEQPLALPTLQIRIPGSLNHGENQEWTLEWEWMYKSIDTQALKLMGWLLDG
ncbi:hypothetical protein VTN96DRAFT_9336 [Rasamsonia emersonii]